MQIRCEKCGTTYELDEKLLPPAGAPVQCTRCQHVFTAYPPKAAPPPSSRTMIAFPAMDPAAAPPPPASFTPGRTMVAFPGAAAPQPSAPAPAPQAAPPGNRTMVAFPAMSQATSPPPPAHSTQPSFNMPSPAPVRPPTQPAFQAHAQAAPAPQPQSPMPKSLTGMWFDQGNALSEPTPSAAVRPAPPEAVAFKKNDTLMNFEAQVKKSSRMKWMLPLAGVLLVAAAGGAYAWISSRIDPRALALRAEGDALLAKDDTASLKAAADELAQAEKADAKLFEAAADRGLALALLGADRADDAAAIQAEGDRLKTEDTRVTLEKAAGWEKQHNALADKMRPIAKRLDEVQSDAKRIQDDAYDALKVVYRAHPQEPAVLRALAVLYAYQGDDKASGFVKNGRAAAPNDPWLGVAEGVTLATGPNSQARRQHAVKILSALPLLRARMLEARAQSDLGDRDRAMATLEGVLAQNPQHDRARARLAALKAELAPGPTPPVSVKVPDKVAPPPHGRKAGKLPRK